MLSKDFVVKTLLPWPSRPRQRQIHQHCGNRSNNAVRSTMSTTTVGSADVPHRCIFNDVDMRSFMESSTKKELLQFVEAIGKSCASGNAPGFDPQSPLTGLTPSMASLHGSLCQMVTWVRNRGDLLNRFIKTAAHNTATIV